MIVLYKGSRGRGKTLTMVKDAYDYYINGYEILSNIKLRFGNYIEGNEIIRLNKGSNLYNCVLLIDEAQIFFDSRNFSRQENKEFSNFVQQIRKRNIIILYTTQFVNTVDIRIRQNTDIVAFPKYDKNKDICLVDYYDLTSIEDGIDVKKIKRRRMGYKGGCIFPLYDTYEMIR